MVNGRLNLFVVGGEPETINCEGTEEDKTPCHFSII